MINLSNFRLFVQKPNGDVHMTDYAMNQETQEVQPVVTMETAARLGIDKTKALAKEFLAKLPNPKILTQAQYSVLKTKSPYVADSSKMKQILLNQGYDASGINPKSTQLMFNNSNISPDINASTDTIQLAKVQSKQEVAKYRPQKPNLGGNGVLLQLSLNNTTSAPVLVPVFDSKNRWKFATGFNPSSITGITVGGTAGTSTLTYLASQTVGGALEISHIKAQASTENFYSQGNIRMKAYKPDLSESDNFDFNISNWVGSNQFNPKIQETPSDFSTMISPEGVVLVLVPAGQTVSLNLTVRAETLTRDMDLI